MKKTKIINGRRALLYILTPLFCALLCLGAVFSIALNNNKVYAAASPTAILSVTNTHFREVTSPSNADYSVRNPSFSYDDIIKNSYKLTNETESTLTNQSNTANYTLSYVGNSAKPTLNGQFVLTEFTIGYRIPARTEYKVDYNFAISMQRSNSSVAQGCTIELFMLGQTDAQDCGTMSGTTLGFTALTQSPYVVASATKTGSEVASDTFSTSVTYSNRTDDEQTITTSLVLKAGNTASPGTTSYWKYAKLTVQPNVTQINDLWVEAPADISVDYSGTEYTDSNLDTIASITSSEWYDPSKMTLSLQDGSAQNAGNYNVDVALINANPTDDPWKLSNGTFSYDTQAVKLTINKVTPLVSFGFAETTDQYTAKGTQDEFPIPTVTYDGNTVTGTINWGSQFPEGSSSGTRKDYDYTFTPEDTTNYNTVTSSISLNYKTATVQSITVTIKDPNLPVYASTDKTILADDFFTVMVKYTGIAEEEEVKTYDIIGWKAGENVPVQIMIGTVISNIVTVPSIGIDKIENLTVIFDQGSNVITPLTTGDELKPMFTNVIAKWNYSNETKSLAANEYEVEFTPVVGTDTSTVTVKYTNIDDTVVSATPIGTITVVLATYDVADITLSGNKNPEYDGQAHALTISKALPAGVTAVITYKKDGDAVASTTAPTDAGTYTVTLSFTQDDTVNYETITKTVTETLTIAQADYPNAGNISFAGGTITHDGNKHKLEATGVPAGVTVTYKYGSTEQSTPFEFEDVNESGYTVKAIFSHTNPNYKKIADKEVKLIITNKNTYNVSNLAFTVSGASGSNGAYTATYSPDSAITFALGGKLLDKEGGEVTPNLAYKYEKSDGNGGWTEVNAAALKNAGSYRITATATTNDATYADVQPFVATLTIAKANYNSVSFDDMLNVVYDGEEHTLTVTGTLSEGVNATYSVKNKEGTSFTEIGEYEFTVTFSNPDPENYNDMRALTATLKIVEPSETGISASLEVGTYIDVTNTLADLKPHITVTINLTGNNSETTEDFVLTCSTLRDGGLLEVGQQKVTVTHGEYTTTVTITVNKATAARPEYSGTLGYTGGAIKPTAADFDGFDGKIMAFVDKKLQSGVNAGSYFAVFALTDTDRYEWAAAQTYSLKPFAKVVTFDGEAAEPQLAANEISVEWNVAKAVVTATKADSGLPVFKSQSYKGAWGNVVTLKYYTDETCTTEVGANDLAAGTKYYAKVELADAANFALDDSVIEFLDPFPYSKAAPALSTGDKVQAFLKANWLWLVLLIAIALIVTMIILLVKRSEKKKREKEEERRQERMMRFMQTEGMPDYIPMMQSARMAGTTVSPELLAILSGINAKIELLQQNTAALPPPSQQTASPEQSGVSQAALSEMIEAAVKKALAENAEAKPAAPKHSPIDLASRPLVDAEAIRRAEEPVDDGRIVDWGGFYKRVDEEGTEDKDKNK